jgi:hypothetical protein
MKYIITENKMNDLIEKVLKKNEPEIIDVEFGTRKVVLASKTEKHNPGDVVEKTLIKVTVDNIDKHLMQGDYNEIYRSIRDNLNSYLNINLNEYGVLYDLEFYALEKSKKFG